MEKLKIILVENVHPVAKQKLEEQGFDVQLKSYAPSEDELCELVRNCHALGLRSRSEITPKVLHANANLLAIGAFCIGTNQIALDCANQLGIPVFNAPYSNTRSVAELVISELVILARQLGDRNSFSHRGEWLKSADGSREVRGKTIGIVGYGHVGSQVSVLAEAMGLRVLFYDIVKKLPLGNAQPCASLKEMMEKSDFVTLHVPETPLTKDMISQRELSWMRKGSSLINASRGTVVVLDDLAAAMKSEHLAGCAVDVFPEEPATNRGSFVSVLQGIPNVFLTPHIGGSTEEAQHAIGIEVAESFRRFLKVGSTAGAVNFPQVDLPVHSGAHRILNVHKNEPGVLGEINGVVSRHGVNIQAQFLSTDSRIGYLVMDVERGNAEEVTEAIERLPRSIKTRVVY
jgi:D-3-phosphoglycerate dehydrogenase / 2-oxoglutarate reductase